MNIETGSSESNISIKHTIFKTAMASCNELITNKKKHIEDYPHSLII